MRAGKLRHVVSIQSLTAGSPTKNSIGEVDESWGTLYSGVKASIEPLSVRELLAAEAVQSKMNLRITMRYLSGIDGTMRVVDADGGVYAIDGEPINPGMRNRELQLMCHRTDGAS